jgi:hypothetical protein
MMQTDVQWYIAREGKQHGPVSDAEMRKLVELGHLRASDLVWRQGFPDWKPAVAVFPQPAPAHAVAPAPAPVQPTQTPQPQHSQSFSPAGTPHSGRLDVPTADPATAGARPMAADRQAEARRATQQAAQSAQQAKSAKPSLQDFETDEPVRGGRGKMLAAVAAVMAMLAAGAWFVMGPKGGTGGKVGDASSRPATSSSAAQTGASSAVAPAAAPVLPVSAANPTLDERLQKIPTWQLLKRDYSDWYEAQLKQATELAAQGKTEGEIDKHLVGEIVKLRRQYSKDALSVPAERLKIMATAFHVNLKALEAEGIAACYAFISRGETVGAVVELMHNPDAAKNASINTQLTSIFDSIAIGRKTPVTHDAPQKPDYDILAAELGKIGWTQGDMQLFANPKNLASASPSKVCSMVQEWFRAHLAISDAGVQERLLFETLKPVVGG